MKLKDQTTIIRDLAFSLGVLETLLANYPVPEPAKAGAREAHSRMENALVIVQQEPVTY